MENSEFFIVRGKIGDSDTPFYATTHEVNSYNFTGFYGKRNSRWNKEFLEELIRFQTEEAARSYIQEYEAHKIKYPCSTEVTFLEATNVPSEIIELNEQPESNINTSGMAAR